MIQRDYTWILLFRNGAIFFQYWPIYQNPSRNKGCYIGTLTGDIRRYDILMWVGHRWLKF